MALIGTITINPAVDETLEVEKTVKEDQLRALSVRHDPGGKGINVSRVVHQLGEKTIAYGMAGGRTGALLEERLRQEGVPCHFLAIQGETRTNITITDDSDHTQIRVSLPGPRVTPEELARLLDEAFSASPRPDWWVVGGSLPPGVPHGVYATMLHRCQDVGIPGVLDADGDALELALAAKPHMIKPNIHEAQRLVGRKLTSEADVLQAAKDIVAKGVDLVLVSRGPRGAVAVSKDEAWEGVPPHVEAISKVGAGDSALAGAALALCRGQGLNEAVRWAVACGTAAVLTPGTQLCRREDVERLLPEVKVRPAEHH